MAALRKLALALTAALIAAPASAQLRPSSPEAIAGAVVDCWASVGPGAVNLESLQQRGWKAGTMTSPGGGKVDTPLKFYGKSGSNVMIMLMGDSAQPMCSVMSRVGKLQDVSSSVRTVRQGLIAMDPQVKAAKSGSGVVFLSLPKIAMLDATGSKDAPGVRIVVGYQVPEKK